MNTKRCIAGGMALLMLAGGILGNTVHIPAQTRQETDASPDKYHYRKQETEFIQTDDLQSQAPKTTLRRLQVNQDYSLSESIWADSGSDY